MRWLPVWRTWLDSVLPHLAGPRVLEVSFGTGYLLGRYASRLEVCGLERNRRMIEVARAALARSGRHAALVQGDVAQLPFPDARFDTVVNTMALSGYPRAAPALAEMRRVLRPGGRLLLLDVGYPGDGNWIGTLLTEGWKRAGDLIRPVAALLEETGFCVADEEVGGFGSVHLYRAVR